MTWKNGGDGNFTDPLSSQIHPGLALAHNTLRVFLILTSVPHKNVTILEPETQALAQSQDSDYEVKARSLSIYELH